MPPTSSIVPARVPGVAVARDGPERLLRPGAADEDRQVGLDRARAAQRLVHRGRAALVAEPLAVEQAAHEPDRLVEPVEPLAEAGPEVDPEGRRARARTRRRRCRGPPGRPQMWSRVVASFAVSPGLRNVLAPTINPSRTARGDAAERRQGRPALEDRLLPRPEDREEVIPRPDRVPAGPPRPRARRRGTPARSVVLRPELGAEPVAPGRPSTRSCRNAEAHPLLGLEAIADEVLRLAGCPRGSGGPSRRCRPGPGWSSTLDRAGEPDAVRAVRDR